MSQESRDLSAGADGRTPPTQQPQHNNPFIFYQPPPPGRENVPRPASDQWLRNPAWIGVFFLCSYTFLLLTLHSADGGVQPPQFYLTNQDIDANRRAHFPRIQALHEADRRVRTVHSSNRLAQLTT